MANRRIQPEIQEMFEKYVTNISHVRRLEREDALRLLQTEFSLTPTDASDLLDYFDADKNGSLSLWEFQHFYTLAGQKVADTVSQFYKLDADNKKHLLRDEIEAVLKTKRSADGKELVDRDIEAILKTAKDPERIVLGDFIALTYRLRLYRKGGR